MKTLIYLALAAAMLPGIKAAQNALAGYQHMQASVAMLADPSVLRDNSRFAACVKAAQGQSAAMGATDSPLASAVIDADPAQCHATEAPRWVAVR